MAERVGFEPTNTREDVTGIPVQRLRPLGHLSIQCVTGIDQRILTIATGVRLALSYLGAAPFGGVAGAGSAGDGALGAGVVGAGAIGAGAAGVAGAGCCINVGDAGAGAGFLRQNCHHLFGFGGGVGSVMFRGLLK
jgi:hypothetical protein